VRRDELVAELAGRIAALERPHPTRVAIDGVDAAGKTTLADELGALLSRRGRALIRAGVDGFHRPAAERHARGADSPAGYYHDAFDYPALIGRLLAPLGPGGSLCYRARVFDYRADTAVEEPEARAAADAVLLLDGVFLHRPELLRYWDLSIWLDVEFSVAQARAERRDLDLFGSVGEVRRRYRERYVPGQQLYLNECRPWALATVVVANDDPERPRIVPPDSIAASWTR